MRSRISVVFFAMVLLCAGTLAACSGQLGKLLEQQTSAGQQASAEPSYAEVVAGLKEALAQGTTHAIDTLGQRNGFWGNALVRIALPDSVQQVADVARKLGFGAKVNAFQLSLNRAAEKSVTQVADIFGGAIRKMTLADARDILTGGDHAATQYFRRVAGTELAQRILPIVTQATNSVEVTSRYKQLLAVTEQSKLGSLLGLLGGEPSPQALDLDQYVTQKTIDGLFYEIGKQEAAIREDPLARTTELLKKVFAGH